MLQFMTLPSKFIHGPLPKGTKISYLKKYFCNHIHSVSIYSDQIEVTAQMFAGRWTDEQNVVLMQGEELLTVQINRILA